MSHKRVLGACWPYGKINIIFSRKDEDFGHMIEKDVTEEER